MTKSSHMYASLLETLRARMPGQSVQSPASVMDGIAMGVLAGDAALARAAEDIELLKKIFVDYNEIRVARTGELTRLLGGKLLVGSVWSRCRDLQQILRDIFNELGNLNLDTADRKSVV